MENITLNVEGMSCQGCVNSVTKVLQPIQGVSKVVVTLKPGQAKIEYDPAKTTVDVLRQAIENAGYDVEN